MPSLTKAGLIDGAKQAALDGLSFDAYCELIAKMIISGQTVDQVKALLRSHGLDVYFEDGEPQRVVSEIQSQYVDENDLFRTIVKRIYEIWDATENRWTLKKIEYIFEDPEYPVPSDTIEVAVETRNGWVVPPDWKFSSEVWIYTRKPVDAVTYDSDSEVMVLREDEQ